MRLDEANPFGTLVHPVVVRTGRTDPEVADSLIAAAVDEALLLPQDSDDVS